MIEFALLFALGFLTAAILGLLAAPAVYKRIVRFAEDRLKATMPLSPQEVRAQKDAARASYAAENARTSQTLKRERDKTVTLMLQNDAVLKDAQRLAGENADLHTQIADMNVEAADLRSTARQLEHTIERLKASLADVERDNVKKNADIKTLHRQLDHFTADLDNLKIDAVTSDTEVENLKSRIAGLRDERENLRNELKAESARARELEARLARDETRIRQSEAKLARAIAANADKDSSLERRGAEIERLKAKIRDAGATGLAVPVRKDRKPLAEVPAREHVPLVATPGQSRPTSAAIDLTLRADAARNRAAALSERLLSSDAASHDDALREEIADIAATMVVLTTAKEGPASPIPALLNPAGMQTDGSGKSLARRVKNMLPPEQP